MVTTTYSIQKWRKQSRSLETDSFQSSFYHTWGSGGRQNCTNQHVVRSSLKIWACIVLQPKFVQHLLNDDQQQNRVGLLRGRWPHKCWWKTFKEHRHRQWNILLVRLYGTNKVSVTEVLETSGLSFVYKTVITFTMSWRLVQSCAHHQSPQDGYLLFAVLSYIFYCSLNVNHQYQSTNWLS